MILKSKLYLCILLSIPAASFATEHIYQEIESKIDHLENSMIQEFSIDLPKEKMDRFGKDYTRAAGQLEVKYEIQRKLFYKIEEKYFHLRNDLEKHLANKTLTSTEVSTLKTKIDYATRIIMRSRKLEIQDIYKELKQSLTYCPKLSEIYQQLVDISFNNCSLENINLNKNHDLLSFAIKKRNKFGSWTKSNFAITQEDIKNGQLISRPDISRKSFPYQNFVTQFWTNTTANEQQKFTLYLDHFGSVTEAEFGHKKKAPLIEFLGLKFGSQNINKEIGCDSAKRVPAATD